MVRDLADPPALSPNLDLFSITTFMLIEKSQASASLLTSYLSAKNYLSYTERSQIETRSACFGCWEPPGK